MVLHAAIGAYGLDEGSGFGVVHGVAVHSSGEYEGVAARRRQDSGTAHTHGLRRERDCTGN